MPRSSSRARGSKASEKKDEKAITKRTESQEVSEREDVEYVPIPYPVVMQQPAETPDANNIQEISAEQDTIGMYEYEEMDTCGRVHHAIVDTLASPLVLLSAPRARTAAGLAIGSQLRTEETNVPASAG